MAPSAITGGASLIHLFLLIENCILRAALTRLLRKYSDLLVVGQGGQPDLLPTLDQQCDVLIIDSAEIKRLQESIGVKSTGQTACKTILIGMNSDEEQFIAAIRSGVTGYLLQDASSSDVVDAVRAVFRGETVCPPKLCCTLFRFVVQTARDTRLQNSASKPDLSRVAVGADYLYSFPSAAGVNPSQHSMDVIPHRELRKIQEGSDFLICETSRD